MPSFTTSVMQNFRDKEVSYHNCYLQLKYAGYPLEGPIREAFEKSEDDKIDTRVEGIKAFGSISALIEVAKEIYQGEEWLKSYVYS